MIHGEKVQRNGTPGMARLRKRVEHPAGNSAVDPGMSVGHQPLPGPTSGIETPPDIGFCEGLDLVGSSPPGRTPVQGPRTHGPKAHSLIDKVYRWSNLYLGIPVVADRVVGQALLRKGPSTHDAIDTLTDDISKGYRIVIDADIASFFDRLIHRVVMSRVRRRIADGQVLNLIQAFLEAGILEKGVVSVPTEGTPQGGVISPFVRYADDFVVLCKTQQEAERPKAYQRFQDRVRWLARRQQGRNVDQVLQGLNPVLRGWANYFGVVDTTKQFLALDSWIRMRIRSFKYKRRCRKDNIRLPNKRLARWGLLSLNASRPDPWLSFRWLSSTGV